MALKKTITNEKGVATSYHKIKDIIVTKSKDVYRDDENNVDVDLYDLMVSVSSFVSAEIRQASERLAADRTSVHLVCTIDELEKTPIMELCYRKLKETDTFKEAEDC